MKLNKILKDKKGAALEMAIIFMLVIFCFCTLLTTMTLTSRSRIKLEKVFFDLDVNNEKSIEQCLIMAENALAQSLDEISNDDNSTTYAFKKGTVESKLNEKLNQNVKANCVYNEQENLPITELKCTFTIETTSSTKIIVEVQYKVETKESVDFSTGDKLYYPTLTKSITKLNKSA